MLLHAQGLYRKVCMKDDKGVGYALIGIFAHFVLQVIIPFLIWHVIPVLAWRVAAWPSVLSNARLASQTPPQDTPGQSTGHRREHDGGEWREKQAEQPALMN